MCKPTITKIGRVYRDLNNRYVIDGWHMEKNKECTCKQDGDVVGYCYTIDELKFIAAMNNGLSNS